MYNYNKIGMSGLSGIFSFISNMDMEKITGVYVWVIVSFILSLVGGVCIYFFFVRPKKEYDNKYLMWLKNFLDFRFMSIETILKIAYIFVTLDNILVSFALISTSFVSFLVTLIYYNIIVRVIYEALMIFIGIWKNTTDINKKMK